ncbi:MAG: excinuclease ABC subunit UvrA, partial [Planctomycetia bacterium]|nr:excinuclease ABC subunit UvrA [Planctomycetia bacterium]
GTSAEAVAEQDPPVPPLRKGGRRSAADSSNGDAPGGDLNLSAHYACTACGISFEPPSPQLFSFNSPQGMCGTCDGLGERYDFDPDKLIPFPDRSFQQGCCELIGKWRELGRWRRHIFQGVADTLEYKHQLDKGKVLETPWEDLEPRFRKMLLYGTGDLHVTYTWPTHGGEYKYGGKFEGIVPELLHKFKTTKSGMQRRQLEKYMSMVRCADCGGERLNAQARSVRLTTTHERFRDHASLSLPQVCALAVSDAVDFFSNLALDTTGQHVAAEVLKEIRGRLGFLLGVGLDYLTLDRTAPTLSGGESQRIRLAGQIGCGLVGVTYILDEPSIGLHQRDNERLLDSLLRLRDLGNTVVVVEHDEDTMRAADHIIDFGPGPGVRGGHVVAAGNIDELKKAPQSVTGKYLSGEAEIAVPPRRRPPNRKWLKVIGASHNNLKEIDVAFPLGTLICVTGVSGSGKSSLVNDILAEALGRDLNKGIGNPGKFARLEGLEHLDKLIAIDQSPIGRTPRSNPGTYVKVFDDIRRLFAQLPESKARGYKEGRFSFNVEGGRCEACEGNGSNRLEMDFLADVWVTCPVCEGHRFSRETLQVRFKGKSIAEVLEMDVQQALVHFENIPKVKNKLQTLHDVGLDYIKIGQPSPTLSGGEAQRIKLARELCKRSTGRTLYLLDEPTTGLHFHDIKMLLKVLHDFVDAGNTVLIVEHNLDVIKTADWIIDLGPEGGAGGGWIVAEGAPEKIASLGERGASAPRCYTGEVLKDLFAGGRHSHVLKRPAGTVPAVTSIKVRGARQHNLKGIDVEIPRDKLTVCCGKSGSGKSSLAMDTIYAEGQRRYVESLSSYARQFVGQMQKPLLEHIEGLSPAIAIEQKNVGHTPRSTVGTVTEIYDYFRILFARLGKPHCPACDIPIGTQTVDEIVDKLMAHDEGTRLFLLAPLDVQVGETYETLWDEVRTAGYVRVRIDGQTHAIDQVPLIDRRRKHAVEVVIDRLIIRPDARSRIADSVESALAMGRGVVAVAYVDDKVAEPKWQQKTHSQHFACDKCGRSFEPLTPHNFSFNSSLGWCEACQGLGTQLGANPAALIRDPKRSLFEGALAMWPELEPGALATKTPRRGLGNIGRTEVRPTGGAPSAAPLGLARLMLEALCTHTGIPGDVPFEQLSHRHRRLVLHGTGDEWIEVSSPAKRGAKSQALFRFQYKGLYPALDEAAKLSPFFRSRLERFTDEVQCSVCDGSRLRDDAAAVRFRMGTIHDFCRLPLGALLADVKSWKLATHEAKVAGELTKEIRDRVQFLVDVGLDYLTLARPAPTLSGGEAQRIRLASQVGSGLSGVLYVLDEPTIGLHPRDNRRLLAALGKLRDLGNTLLLVEHDREVVQSADRLLDFGPGAGRFGGQIVAEGSPQEIAAAKASVTGPYLSGKKAIPVPTNRRRVSPARHKFVEIIGARHNNLKNIDVRIPLGTLMAISGTSGSGKSSLVDDVLFNSVARLLHRASTVPGAHDEIRGLDQINKVIRVDQQPLGNTPTSNPATYTGVFELVRMLFAQLPESKVRGFSPRRFSFNVPGGRCEKCEGNGQLRIEMHFLPDVWVECDTCRSQRYNPETLAVRYKNHSIADVLSMPIGDAARLFENIPKVRRILQMLCDVGLDYLTLGQPAPTLSGGEAQRVKLAAELARPDTGRTLYLLDEPTTGLHFEDLAKLLDVLNRLVDLGNTVVVIEHNLDVIKSCDWVIDLGPEAGADGGHVVAEGTPEEIVRQAKPPSASAALASAPSPGTPGEGR